MTEDLFAKLRADLEKSGLRSELSVRRMMSEKGWSVDGGGAYHDLDEDKSREFDLSAAKVARLESGKRTCCYLEFHLVGEVKKSERPWVVFKRPLPSWSTGCAWNNLIRAINLPCEPARLARPLGRNSLLSVNGWIANGLHEAFKSPDMPSRWYSAFVSVCKAADSYLSTHSPEGDQTTEDLIANPAELFFVQPLVILDGQLISVELTADGEMQFAHVDSAAFQFSYKTQHYTRSHYRVDLVTVAGLPAYLDQQQARLVDIQQGIGANAPLPLTPTGRGAG